MNERWLNEEPPDPRGTIVAEWLTIAKGDLDTAGRDFAVVNNPNLRAFGLHAQQAVEKLMKAVLISKGADAPRTHDLNLLDGLIRQVGVESLARADDLRMLTWGAVDMRYPGMSISADSAATMLRTAQAIWATLRPLV